MSRSPFKIRELVLVCLPLALIGVGGWLISRQQSGHQETEEHPQKVQQDDISGPYRTQIVSEQVVPVSPFEAWQGFDTKIEVQVKEAGNIKFALKGSSSLWHRMDPEISLYGTIKGKHQKVPQETFDASDSKSILSNSELPPPQTFRILLPFNTPPTDVKGTPVEEKIIFLVSTSAFDINSPVALRGSISYRNGSLFSKAATLNTVIRKAGERKEVHVDHTPAIPPPSVSVSNLSPRYSKTSFVGDNGTCFVRIRFKNGLKPDSKHHLHLLTEGFYDDHGKPAVFKVGSTISGFSGGIEEVSTPNYAIIKRLHNEAILKANGEINMKMAVGVGDGWPTQINAVVWPSWFSRPPKTLQIRSVVVDGGSIIVNAHYSGSKSLAYQTFDKSNTLRYFDSRLEAEDELPPKTKGEDRLFTDWSQHFTLPNGRSYWFKNAVSVQGIECDSKNNCRIIYTTNALAALKPGQSAKFHADIGIEDDGFLPIDTIITRPKS